jgi:superfamily II DNA/RNA helicase
MKVSVDSRVCDVARAPRDRPSNQHRGMSKRTREEEEAKAARKAARKAEKKAAKAASKVLDGTSPSATPEKKPAPRFAAFEDAPFVEPVRKALQATFTSPSEIQSQAWPAALTGNDLIAVAKTGSGKTLAFVLPVLHRLSAPAVMGSATLSVRALVLSPTRELALQIHAEAERFGKLVGIDTMAVYGGTPLHEQKTRLAKAAPALLVATPGRLVDLIEQKAASLTKCETIVLDEADRLLDMGFKPQLEATFNAMAPQRQVLLFTATWPKAVRKLAAAYLRNEKETTTLFLGGGSSGASADGKGGVPGEGDGGVAAAASGGDACELSANVAVSQSFIKATDDEKDNKLWAFLSELAEGSRVIVFANTKRRVDNLAKTFCDFGTCSIHGDKPQREREAALASFAENRSPLMMATDVAARGLDIKLVSHVVNYDMARDVASYVHRIGRTGRAGAVGESVTFWNPDYDKECAPALVRIARKAGQEVPDWLAKFESAKANKLWAVAKADKEVDSLAAEINGIK